MIIPRLALIVKSEDVKDIEITSNTLFYLNIKGTDSMHLILWVNLNF